MSSYPVSCSWVYPNFSIFFTVLVGQQCLLLEKMGKGWDISYQTAFFLAVQKSVKSWLQQLTQNSQVAALTGTQRQFLVTKLFLLLLDGWRPTIINPAAGTADRFKINQFLTTALFGEEPHALFFFSKGKEQTEVMDVPLPDAADLVFPKPQVTVVSFRSAISFLQGFISIQTVCTKCLGRTETRGCHWHPWP